MKLLLPVLFFFGRILLAYDVVTENLSMIYGNTDCSHAGQIKKVNHS